MQTPLRPFSCVLSALLLLAPALLAVPSKAAPEPAAPPAAAARDLSVTVSGAVAAPGTRTVHEGAHLDDVMRLAVPSLDADLTAVKITHSPLASQAPATVNYLAFLDNKDLSGNPVLMDRDVVTVARKSEAALQVGVLGQVAAPGRYQLPSGSTVLDAVRKAQGLTDDADRGHIVVRHANGGAEVTVDYDAAEKSPSTLTANPELNDGDTVTVGGVARPRSYTIAGAVLHPGEYPLPEAPLTLADAIGKAGGLADRPKLDQVSIVRRDASGKVSVVKIKANDPSVQGTTIVQPGDNITIPQGAPRQRVDPLQLLGLAISLIAVLSHH